jgi:glycosyltransferase involved in cell wall biosynthesis
MEKLANEKNMKDYGLVSIIMPNWNCAALIGTTIKTVLAQTYENWELLIQDDCSTDNPEASIKDCCDGDPRIKFERNKDFSGAAVSRNNALRRASGRWIAFLDSDDLWEPEKLEKQLKFMVENNYHFSYTGYQEIDNYGKKTGCFVSGPKHVSKFGMYSFCWPGCLTVMYERETVGLLQIADIRKNNDYAMWLKICQVADCHLLDEVLAMYRRGRVGSVSTHSCTTMIKWHYKLWHDAMGKNLILSTFWTGMNLVCGVYKKLRYVKRN